MTSTKKKTVKKPQKTTKKTAAKKSATKASLINIPFSDLSAWKENVRKTGAENNIKELEASIQSMGLINPMTVMKSGKKYTVIAGNRRLLAISNLIKNKKLKNDYKVACHVIDADINPAEISLAENVIRQAMHPADQAEAFAYLKKQGMKETDIGARFGVTEAVVKKRLALSNVSAKIIKAYRDGKIGLEHAQAFSLTTDKKAQEKVFKDMDVNTSTSAPDIRKALACDDVRATDRRAVFVGLDAYTDAGGAVKRDLFDDRLEAIFLTNTDLLNDLYNKKLQDAADTLKAEGWANVKVIHQEWIPGSAREGMQHNPPKKSDLSTTDQDKIKKWEKEYDLLEEKLWSLSETDRLRYEELNYLIETTKQKALIWPDKIKAKATAYICVNEYGFLDIERGYTEIKSKAAKKSADNKTDVNDTATTTSQDSEKEEPGLSKKALEDLSNHRSLALSASLARNTDRALRATVYTLALPVLYEQYYDLDETPSLKMKSEAVYAKFDDKPGLYKGLDDLLKIKNEWLDKTPEKETEFWEWCLNAPTQTLLELLAYVAALSLDDMNGGATKAHAESLWREMKVDMTKWYAPTKDGLFQQMNKKQLLSVVKELGKDITPSMEKSKKAELADAVAGMVGEMATEGHYWLPTPLRLPQSEETASEENEQQEAA